MSVSAPRRRRGCRPPCSPSPKTAGPKSSPSVRRGCKQRHAAVPTPSSACLRAVHGGRPFPALSKPAGFARQARPSNQSRNCEFGAPAGTGNRLDRQRFGDATSSSSGVGDDRCNMASTSKQLGFVRKADTVFGTNDARRAWRNPPTRPRRPCGPGNLPRFREFGHGLWGATNANKGNRASTDVKITVRHDSGNRKLPPYIC